MEQAVSGAPILASWGSRFAAILVDDLIVVAPAGIGVILILSGAEGAGFAIGLVFLLFALTIGQALYFTILNGNKRGQTYGKRLLGIRVIDVREGGPIGYGRSLARWGVPTVLNLFFGFFFLIDGLWPLWDVRNQALHDKFANSIVVRVQN
jgi:uncharacterized RDD family membrane protein YckC